MSENIIADCQGACLTEIPPNPDRKKKAADIARESDGSTQCVQYPGWRIIAERIAARKEAA